MKRLLLITTALLVCIVPLSTHARGRVAVPAQANLSLSCIRQAADRCGVPLAALLGILATEGGQPGLALSNTNGTGDMGPVQVHTGHREDLLEAGWRPEDVLGDACVNAQAAAWLLRKEMGRSRSLWEALGAYHSRTPKFHNAYVGRLRANLVKLRQGRVASLIEYANGQRKDW